MKYIKLFESYNKKYYYNAKDFSPSGEMKLVDISDNVINILKSKMRIHIDSYPTPDYDVTCLFVSDYPGLNIDIYQYEDDWFEDLAPPQLGLGSAPPQDDLTFWYLAPPQLGLGSAPPHDFFSVIEEK